MAETKETIKIKKSKAHLLKTDRGIFPVVVLKEYEKDNRKSKQLEEADEKYARDNGLMPVPVDQKMLLELKDNNTIFDACVKQVAADVVGQGWKIMPLEEDKEMVEADKEKTENFLNDPNNDDETVVEIFLRCLQDRGYVGGYALEIAPETGSTKAGMWHVPSHTIRVHKSKDKYCQLRGQKKRWFKRYGIPEDINKDTGDPSTAKDDAAHEMIYAANYYPQSDYYGAPDVLPAIGAVFGMIGVRDFNLAFFENYGIPAGFLELEGEWEEDSVKNLNDFLNLEIKGSENAHKTMVIELTKGSTVKWTPLSVEVKEGSFRLYFEGNRDEILAAHKMPPYRVGIAETGSLGGNAAQETNKIYISAVINRIKNETERTINRIIRETLGIETIKFEWEELDIRDLDSMAKRFQIAFGLGAINRNYIRKNLFGLEPLEDGDGEEYYINKSFMEIGAESIEKVLRRHDHTFEDFATKIQEALTGLEDDEE